MKKISVLIVLILTVFSLSAQNIKGHVTDEQGDPLPGATVKLNEGRLVQSTDKNGNFIFRNLKARDYKISVSYIGFETEIKNLTLSQGETLEENFSMKIGTFATEEVVVWSTRAKHNDPVSYTNISKEDIEKKNPVQDIPFLLNMTPGLVCSSDGGTGVGYTSMRIRGSDFTRINITLDGVPLNDSESQMVYWVDLPDYAASAENIQVQRGVGTSTNGAGAFGANINFRTQRPNIKPEAEINAAYGSFNTYKTNIKASSGIINDRFAFSTRISKIYSDGYIDRAYTDMESVQMSGMYFDKNKSLRLNLMHGVEDTYQAWGGVPKDSLKTNRRYNPYTYDNEIDHYTQTHAQLFYTQRINDRLFLKTALHYTKGAGYYEQFKDGEDFADYNMPNYIINNDTISETDLIRRKWLDNHFGGIVINANYSQQAFDLNVGGSINRYVGGHFGKVIKTQYAPLNSLPHKWYDNTGYKDDRNIYAKMNYRITDKITVTGDLQFRNIMFSMDGKDDDNRDITQDNKYNFFNPKGGINYAINSENRLYFSVARAQREPTRTDLKDAVNSIKPTAEKLLDYELGYGYASSKVRVDLNLYYMDYKDQLVLTGQVNDVGSAISVNVPESYRAGVEISAGTDLFDIIHWEANAAFSKNKIKNFTSYIDDWDNGGQQTEFYSETDISFSPEVVVKNSISVELMKGLEFTAATRYIGRQYIDNTTNKDRSIEPYLVNDLTLNYNFSLKRLKRISLFLSANNVLDEEYETNAWVYRYVLGGEKAVIDGYFPQAKRHYTAGISIKF